MTDVEKEWKDPFQIYSIEKKFINKCDSQVEVSFLLPGRDWYELQSSVQWEQVLEFLNQRKNSNIQKFHKEEQV